MALSNPTALTSATRFRPTHFRTHSRSPSRSPVRKAKFTSQHLDPLLSNLSPESTLKALQATDTIPAGSGQDVLGKSISDASPEEREVGIRAAFAAQQLKAWRREISSWRWPSRRERGHGAGFLPPGAGPDLVRHDTETTYIGFLPLRALNEYEEKIEDIKDGLESLEMEDLKDHVLTAHATTRSAPMTKRENPGVRESYGRMRDFTALVTATVIQALPDLAMVHAMIDTWDVRITVLRDLPMLIDHLATSKETLQRALTTCRDPNQAHHITSKDVTRITTAVGAQIKSAGDYIDKMLDLLEDQEDALPQLWVDQLEGLELDFAAWKEQSKKIAHDNEARQLAGGTNGTGRSVLEGSDFSSDARKPSGEKLKIPAHAGHRREISEVSIADSVLSDVSVGEVIDARKSQIFFSPKVQVVDSNPSSPVRPPVLHRASTASIEVISSSQLKKFDVRRSMSADMLAKMIPGSNKATPPRRIRDIDDDTYHQRTTSTEIEPDCNALASYRRQSTSAMPSPSPSLTVAPLRIQTQQPPSAFHTPLLPRKSSKRTSFGASTALTPTLSHDVVSPVSPTDSLRQHLISPVSASKASGEGVSLDRKIQNILENLPSRIRLGEKAVRQSQSSSSGSTRSSTPTPALIPEVARTTARSAAEPDIRVYHLHQNGTGRDSKPIKLFVRAVGENGERVMVRVGGGWADLAEYLREYSAHHGSRSASEGLLEVAQYPVQTDRHRKTSSQIIPPTQIKPPMSTPKSRRRSLSNSSSGSRSRSPSPPPAEIQAPPVPPIPASYNMYTPTMTVATSPNGDTRVSFEDGDPAVLLAAKGRETLEPEAGPYSRTTSLQASGISTTTTVQSPAAIDPVKYVPLGGAGPIGSRGRGATYGAIARNNEPWVENMVDKARSVSSQTVYGPVTTTTTTVRSSAPASRRVSAPMNVLTKERPSPPSQKVAQAPTQTTSPSQKIVQAPTHTTSPSQKIALPPAQTTSPNQKIAQSPTQTPSDGQNVVRRKSRLGLGDVSGIKRVFLRRKSANPTK